MTDDASTERDPLDLCVEEFLRRTRAGERVDVEAFAAAHPKLAAELRDLLPTLQALEQVKREKESTGGLRVRVQLPALQRLGDFRIVREIGRGGMGVVFEAVQESLSRKVALKVLPQASLLTGNQLLRFQREAQIAARLHHSNIVPVYGSGEADGYHWYAMQFIDGEGLDAWQKREAAAPPQGSGAWRERGRFVAHLGADTASALHHAHTQGTLHRDIKPANLLLDRDGNVWTTDFGLAKALEAEGLTHSGDLLGTLQYMAPEQFAGQYDVRSEVYALGVTLYELLTLQPAYQGRSKSELIDSIRDGRPMSLRRRCPDLPVDLATVVEKAMAHDPKDRYASAQDLQHDLVAFLEDRPIAARRQGTVSAVVRWCRRNRAQAALAGLAIVLGVGAGITGWVAYSVSETALAGAKAANLETEKQRGRAEANLQKMLVGLNEIFDALVGRDPVLMFEEDLDTGEQTVVASRAVDDKDVAMLGTILGIYQQFASDNAESQDLRFQTARAFRRVGLIQSRLGRFDEAAIAYTEALRRYQDVNDRDVTRELAAVYVEFGQLEQQRGRLFEGMQDFRKALGLLEVEPTHGDSKALRFDRANAHFLLARSFVPFGRDPSGARPMRQPGGDRRDPRLQRDPRDLRDPRRRDEEARKELTAAQDLVTALLAEDPQNADLRLLDARCQLLSSMLRQGTESGRSEDEVARSAEAQKGLQTLRELVSAQPDAPHLQFELAEALVQLAREEPPGLPAGPGSAGRSGEDRQQRLKQLSEAREHADALLALAPGRADAKALRARIAAEIGGALVGRRGSSEISPKNLDEAERELRIACATEQEMLANGSFDRRMVLHILQSATRLDRLLRQTGRTEEADAAADALGRALLAVKAQGEAASLRMALPPDDRGGRWQPLSSELRKRLEAIGLQFGGGDPGGPGGPGGQQRRR